MNALLTIDHLLALIAIGVLFLIATGLDSVCQAIAAFRDDYLRMHRKGPLKRGSDRVNHGAEARQDQFD